MASEIGKMHLVKLYKKLAKQAKSRMHLVSMERMQNLESITPTDMQLNEAARDMRRRQEKVRLEIATL